ncbi:hypothetical protein Ddye_021370 [Dipteronia dyeriana]|uniref:Transmembrane protein n=1 Tax=Dipteronia dyeriana TaxID=168575 RepID=A0AAD9U1H0_9ROSI|nr:hypothetical protein Ddye_021370 [Dipteronia dyeriana]
MKSLHFIYLCMLTTFAFFFFIQYNFGSSAYSTNFHPRKQVPKSSSNHKGPCQQFQCEMQVNDKDDDDGRKQSRVAGGDKVGDDDVIVYHIDYHGVTTHPNPTPKHPKP